MYTINCYSYYMKFSLQNCDSINASLLPVQGFLLNPYIENLRKVESLGEYSVPESSINLPTDEELLTRVEEVAAKFLNEKIKYIFVVGIGGSNLGTKAIYDGLGGDNLFARKIIFLDTNNSTLLSHCYHILSLITSLEEIVIVSISKSGGTSETLANTEILLDVLFPRFGTLTKDRLLVITDEGSPYMEEAKGRGVTTLGMPTIVGGRFSVLSTVGLLPLLLAGVDIKSLRAGAGAIRAQCLNIDINNNPAAQSALVAQQAYQHGQFVHDTFVFNAELESLGKWYRQLLGESIGKSEIGVTSARVGFVPTVSVGSTDLHSVGQLYLGGPARILTTFVHSAKDLQTFNVPKDRLFPKLAPMITGKSSADIMSAIMAGTMKAYNDQSLPFMEIIFDGITAYELGAFMQFKMIEMMFLGRLFSVDTFNQQAVELYKVETKRILESIH